MIEKLEMPAPLYVSRPLVNAHQVLAWARDAGFKTTLPADELHVTVVFSRQPVDWFAPGYVGRQDTVQVAEGGPRSLERFGDAVVLRFQSPELAWRWQDFRDAGASWDHGDYTPHVTLTYNGADLNLDTIEPYQGPLEFGPEHFAPIKEDWAAGVTEKSSGIMADMRFELHGEVLKAQPDQQLVYGWASVTHVDGQLVVDRQEDVISDATLVKAAHDFILNSRAGKLMHQGERVADVVESVVLTKDLQVALGIDLGKTGWLIGYKVHDLKVWEAAKAEGFSGFSIGGTGQRVES